MTMEKGHIIRSLDQLSEHYAAPSERVILKQIDHLDEHARAFIAASPFALLATCGPGGVDVSPRGDEPGFVHVEDDTTLLLPDRRGNNRIDSIRNIVQNPQAGMIFLVPGINETFRVNGDAHISVDPVLLGRFVVDGKAPRSVIVITVREAFLQCARALLRSDLWNPAKHIPRSALPRTGTVLAAHTKGNVDADVYDCTLKETLATTLY